MSNESSASKARRGLGVYLSLTLIGSAILDARITSDQHPMQAHIGEVIALMWVPAIASFAARLMMREGFADLGLRASGRTFLRWLAIAWLFPLAVGGIAYPVAWLSGLERFAAPSMADTGLATALPLAKLAASIAISMTQGTIIGAIAATGEELGWRGYMLPRLVAARVPYPVLASGVIWGAWHMPLILSGQYAVGRYPLLSVALFAVNVIALAFVIARLWFGSGSVWPPVAAHACWNALIQGTFDRFTDPNAIRPGTLWTGEAGVLVGVVLIAFAVFGAQNRVPPPR